MKAALPDRIPATVLFREIKERGYEGGETRVCHQVHHVNPATGATLEERSNRTAPITVLPRSFGAAVWRRRWRILKRRHTGQVTGW
jgi:hypothetical protein